MNMIVRWKISLNHDFMLLQYLYKIDNFIEIMLNVIDFNMNYF